MGYIWSIYGYFEALISQILAFLWSEFLLYPNIFNLLFWLKNKFLSL